MLIVADTSSLIALAACDGLHLLDRLFKEVKVPPAVVRECVTPTKPWADALRDYLEDKVADVDLDRFAIAAVELGRGELEAMALYKLLGADRLLVDDRRARRVARVNAIQIVGSIGVLLLAKAEGELAAVRPLLDAMQSSGIYLGERVVSEAIRLADEA
jgi:predicted nucleic acid-binding protein